MTQTKTKGDTRGMKNPFLENFRPYIPDSAKLRELDAVAADRRHAARHHFWRVVAVSGAKDGFDRFGVDTGGGHRDHGVSPAFEARNARRDDPRSKCDADGRVGGRIDRFWYRRDDAGDHDPRI